MSEDLFNHSQLFQQAIATTITCRTIIKYNSNLSEEQKAEILGEIETTLVFLEKRQEVNATIEGAQALSPDKLGDLLIEGIEGEGEGHLELQFPASAQEELQIALQNLHKLYYAYLSNKPGKGIAALETRYRTVMGVLDQLQELAGSGQDTLTRDQNIEGLLHRVRGFVTAVYCMFREFAVLLSNIVEGKNIDMDTEALALLRKYPLALLQQQLVRDVTPLVSVYGKHLQLQERKGALVDCARDATAFLIFLEESLGQTFARRKEVASQLKTTTALLNDLTSLLMDYEQAVGNIIQAPSASL